MFDDEELETLLANSIIAVASQWFDEHRKRCDSETCEEPLRLIATIAHNAGWNSGPDTCHTFNEALKEVEAHCPGCAHTRN